MMDQYAVRVTCRLAVLACAVCVSGFAQAEITAVPPLDVQPYWLNDDSETDAFDFPTIIRGQDEGGGGADPSDPTQVTFHIMHEVEWNQLSEKQGDTVAYKISPFIPVKIGEQSFLANVEVPMTYAGTELLGHHTSIGDTRMKFFWLIGTENEFVTAIVPSFDAIAPTGDADLGTGG